MSFEEWFSQFPVKTFKKNSRLYMQGDDLEYCYYLKSGIVSQIIDYENGTEVVTKYHFPNDILNIWGVLKHKTSYPSTAVAKIEITAIVIPAKAMRIELNVNFDFYRYIVETVLENNNYIYQQYQKKTKGSAAEVLCYAILTLCQTDSNGEMYLPKEFSYNDLAQHLRLHRISVSHIFGFLQEENILTKRSYGWHIADVEMLREYASGNLLIDLASLRTEKR